MPRNNNRKNSIVSTAVHWWTISKFTDCVWVFGFGFKYSTSTWRCELSTRLHQLLPVHLTTSCLQKVLAAIMSLSPHSMQVERIISHHNNISSPHRLSMTNDHSVNNRLAFTQWCRHSHLRSKTMCCKFFYQLYAMPNWIQKHNYAKRSYEEKFFLEMTTFFRI